MSTSNFEDRGNGGMLFRHSCGSKQFPLEIRIERKSDGSIYYLIESDAYRHEQSVVPAEGNGGKLTGVQLRAIAAKDQLDTLLEDELFDIVKQLAEASEQRLILLCQIVGFGFEKVEVHEDDPESDSILRAIKAMALFCYTEIVERGLKKPGLEE